MFPAAGPGLVPDLEIGSLPAGSSLVPLPREGLVESAPLAGVPGRGGGQPLLAQDVHGDDVVAPRTLPRPVVGKGRAGDGFGGEPGDRLVVVTAIQPVDAIPLQAGFA